jgi:hypothetical protein
MPPVRTVASEVAIWLLFWTAHAQAWDFYSTTASNLPSFDLNAVEPSSILEWHDCYSTHSPIIDEEFSSTILRAYFNYENENVLLRTTHTTP